MESTPLRWLPCQLVRRAFSLMVASMLAFGCRTSLNAEPKSNDKKQLRGKWVVTTVSWCGKPLDLTKLAKDRQRITLTVKDDHYKLSGTHGGPEEGTIGVDATVSPKQVDLTATTGDIREPRKGIYSVQDGRLKIAFSLWFAPGERDDEAKELKKMYATRPKQLESKAEDLVVILIFERQK